jgi:Cu/Zn superoxide dismutase
MAARLIAVFLNGRVRGLIVHADPDDCGEGGHPTSATTGNSQTACGGLSLTDPLPSVGIGPNSGKRIACAVIGYAKL